MPSRRDCNPYPIRLVYDEGLRQVHPIPFDEPLEDSHREIPLNAVSPQGGYRVWLYQTLEEAMAFSDAVEALLPDYEHIPEVWPVMIGGVTNGVVVVEVDWLGDSTIFYDRRRPWLAGATYHQLLTQDEGNTD